MLRRGSRQWRDETTPHHRCSRRGARRRPPRRWPPAARPITEKVLGAASVAQPYTIQVKQEGRRGRRQGDGRAGGELRLALAPRGGRGHRDVWNALAVRQRRPQLHRAAPSRRGTASPNRPGTSISPATRGTSRWWCSLSPTSGSSTASTLTSRLPGPATARSEQRLSRHRPGAAAPGRWLVSCGMDLCLMIEGQEGVTWTQWVALARACEEHGVPALFRSDHYLELGGEHPERGSLDAWTTLAALGAVTTTLRLGTLVSPATFRHPSVLAKAVATADQISDGRVTLGLGAGWHAREHEAYGFPFPSTARADGRPRGATAGDPRLVVGRALRLRGRRTTACATSTPSPNRRSARTRRSSSAARPDRAAPRSPRGTPTSTTPSSRRPPRFASAAPSSSARARPPAASRCPFRSWPASCSAATAPSSKTARAAWPT